MGLSIYLSLNSFFTKYWHEFDKLKHEIENKNIIMEYNLTNSLLKATQCIIIIIY